MFPEFLNIAFTFQKPLYTTLPTSITIAIEMFGTNANGLLSKIFHLEKNVNVIQKDDSVSDKHLY